MSGGIFSAWGIVGPVMEKRVGNAATQVAGSDGIRRLAAEAPPEVLNAVERELLAELDALGKEPATAEHRARATFVSDALAQIQSRRSLWPGAARLLRKLALKRRFRRAPRRATWNASMAAK